MVWPLDIQKRLNDAACQGKHVPEPHSLEGMSTKDLEELKRISAEIIDRRREQSRQGGFEGPLPGPKQPVQDPHFEGSLKPGSVQ